MQVSFEALIKKVTVKSLVSLDKEAHLLLQFNAENNELIDQINRLHRPDEMVRVKISNERDTETQTSL